MTWTRFGSKDPCWSLPDDLKSAGEEFFTAAAAATQQQRSRNADAVDIAVSLYRSRFACEHLKTQYQELNRKTE
jgi:hypothetical protein